MVEYIGAIVDQIMPLVVFQFSEAVRNSACYALERLFKASVAAVTAGSRQVTFAQQYLMPFVTALLTGLKGEIHTEARTTTAEALKDLFRASFESGGHDDKGDWNRPTVPVPLTAVMDIISGVLSVAQSSIKRRKELLENFHASEVRDTWLLSYGPAKVLMCTPSPPAGSRSARRRQIVGRA